MVLKTTVHLIDDVDGSEADETVEFTLDGVDYQIDLSRKNAELLRSTLEDYITYARRVSSRVRKAGKLLKPRRSRMESLAIRKWARGQGYEVAPTGRIPADIVDAYMARDGASR